VTDMKKIVGWLFLLLLNGGIGFALYRFIPALTVKLDAVLQGTGPLILGIYIAVAFVYAGIVWLEQKIAVWSAVHGNLVLAILCALLIGGAVTVMLTVKWYTGCYSDTWVGLGFVVFVGIGAGCAGYAGMMME